jgi:hypothetical protein
MRGGRDLFCEQMCRAYLMAARRRLIVDAVQGHFGQRGIRRRREGFWRRDLSETFFTNIVFEINRERAFDTMEDVHALILEVAVLFVGAVMCFVGGMKGRSDAPPITIPPLGGTIPNAAHREFWCLELSPFVPVGAVVRGNLLRTSTLALNFWCTVRSGSQQESFRLTSFKTSRRPFNNRPLATLVSSSLVFTSFSLNVGVPFLTPAYGSRSRKSNRPYLRHGANTLLGY